MAIKPAAFFRLPEVQALLERASRAAGTPVSIHYVDRGEEGLRVTGFGRCAACQYVAQIEDGSARCRESRLNASLGALRRDRPVPFVCHMGFACVSVPALPGKGLGFTLTFGPYCPSDAPQTLEPDALLGLAALGYNPEQGLPVSLADIRLSPPGAVPAVADWTAESLARVWDIRCTPADDGVAETDETSDESGGDAAAPARPWRRARVRARADGAFGSGAIAAALAGGNGALARRHVLSALAETESGSRAKLDVRRARAAAILSTVLEAAHRAQLNAGPCWERFNDFLVELKTARTNEQLANAVMAVLNAARRRTQPPAHDADGLVALNRIVMARLTDGMTLNDIAQELGQHPTAITHRLQRKFGLSFSEYVGQLRVAMAKDLLRTTRLSAGEISRRVGIKDGSNLSKLFRKFEGMSPQEYRRRFARRNGK